MHAYSGVLLTLSAPKLHNKTNMQEFSENYRLNVQFLEKLENAPRLEIDFVLDLNMCLADFTCVNGSPIQ